MDGIYNLGDWQWWVSVFYFMVLSVGLWWLPGWLVLNHTTKLSRLTRFFLAPVVGVVMMALVAWGGGMLGRYWLIWVYVGLIALSVIFDQKYFVRLINSENISRLKRGIKRSGLLVVLIALALAVQLPAIVSSGWRGDAGVRFYFTNSTDGLMHIGFIESMAHEFPPVRPEINLPLKDYHYFCDLVMAQLVRCGLPAVMLFCQLMPAFLSVVTMGLLYQTMREVCADKRVAVWTGLVFLLASDGAYWLTFFFPHNHGWEMATLDNGTDVFLNMPYAMAKMIFIGVWLLLNHYWRVRRRECLWLAGAMTVMLTLFKVYWAALVLSGWVVVLAWKMICERKFSREWGLEAGVWLASSLGAMALLASVTTPAAGKLVWVAHLWPKLLTSSEHLGWEELDLRAQVYALDPSPIRQMLDLLAMVAVAIWYVFGARLAAFAVNKRTWKSFGAENGLFFLIPTVFWTVIGFNFMQGVGGWNSFNFLVIALVALLFPLGVVLADWWQSKKWRWLALIVLISFWPRTAHNWWYFVTSAAQARENRLISQPQLVLLDKIRESAAWDEVVMVNVDNDEMEAASILPALAGRRTFLSDQGILRTHNVDYATQEAQVRTVLRDPPDEAMVLADDLGIKYIYLEARDLVGNRYPVATAEAVYRGDEGIIIPVVRPKSQEKVNIIRQ